jgi:dTDP-4-amino-4,6-dideoxygalactose transaminase
LVVEWKVPLADIRVTEEDIAAVVETYRSGWLSMGPRTEELEAAFAEYAGVRNAIAVTNGTAALHLICLVAGLGPGDEVIVPSMTFVATVNAVAYTGATPVFGDIAGLTAPWLSASDCHAALTPRTRAIMAMHYGGHPGDISALRDLAVGQNVMLLEDAAHAVGSRLDGHPLGAVGTAGAFSFFSNKNLAVGEGGMIVTDDDELATSMRLLRSHGMTTLSWDRHRGHATDYDVVATGYNYRIDEPRATLGLTRLARVDEENTARQRLDARYRVLLADVEGVDQVASVPERSTSAHHLFTIVLDEGVDRRRFRAALAEHGVQTSVHYPAAHKFSIYAGDHRPLSLTEAYAERTVTLPLFPHMTEAQQDLVVTAVRGARTPGPRVW